MKIMYTNYVKYVYVCIHGSLQDLNIVPWMWSFLMDMWTKENTECLILKEKNISTKGFWMYVFNAAVSLKNFFFHKLPSKFLTL
jgi:hypothetical protein